MTGFSLRNLQTIKQWYLFYAKFDFLRLSEKVMETDLEQALVQRISRFLPELGIGFAYMGRQYLLNTSF